MFNYEILVPFYDIDPMRVVYHGNYIKYLEEARSAFLNEKNLNYLQMEELGYAFPVVELKIKYIKPCTFYQKIIVTVDLVKESNFLHFKYEIRDKETNERMLKAETKQMCVDIKTKESFFELPNEILSRLIS